MGGSVVSLPPRPSAAPAPLRPVKEPSVAERVGIPDRRPRYFAEDGAVIVTASRRRMTVEQAYAEAVSLLDKATDPTIGTLADAYRDELSDLIVALRGALDGSSPPPAAIARAAA
ncbi:hypothetical protein [Brevundimonas sp. GCM10030266]|uniref:hypothetical protein n=1 Tax=Brevundimonas sp. GCM10030266 TaxID=3273386 RepID=UPI00361AFBC5